MAKSHHVVPAVKGGWNVRRSGAERASRHFDDKETAIKYARLVCKNQKTELYIHRKDGSIAHKDNYSVDPVPPREKGCSQIAG